ncbi:MAG: hypothetical protein ACOYKZ_05905 [Chlamydiia bacterium]
MLSRQGSAVAELHEVASALLEWLGKEALPRRQAPVLPPAQSARTEQHPPLAERNRPAQATRSAAPSMATPVATPETTVLPPTLQIPGKPFSLEFTPGSETEGWSDLSLLLSSQPFGVPPTGNLEDGEARRLRHQWRTRACCADVLVISPPGAPVPFFERFTQAIAQYCCPVVLVPLVEISSWELAMAKIQHPEVRLVILSHEAQSALPSITGKIRRVGPVSTLFDRPVMVLEPWSAYEGDPSLKRALWNQVLLWKRA